MQNFLTFYDFLNEEEVHLNDELEEYTVNNEGDGKFSFELESAPVHFDVLPLPTDLEFYKRIFAELTSAMENDRTLQMYDILKRLQKLPYKFGGLIPETLSLNNVPSLVMNLTNEQVEMLKRSPDDFLRTQFSSLSKELKIALKTYFNQRAQLYAIVLECMFYYTREKSENSK